MLALHDDEFHTVVGHTVTGRVIRPGGTGSVIEEECAAIFRSSEGRLFSLHASWVDHRAFTGGRFEILGDGGRIEVDLAAQSTRLVRHKTGTLCEDVVQFEYTDPDPCWAAEIQAFMEAIQKGKPLEGDGEAGLRAQQMVFAAYESARKGGQPVRLDSPELLSATNGRIPDALAGSLRRSLAHSRRVGSDEPNQKQLLLNGVPPIE